MPVEFEQLRDRAKPWMDPIPGTSPGGVSAKLDPAYQAVANEVAKLDMPAGGAVDWKKVAGGCEDLLRARTKDLLIGSYLAHALHMTRGLDGLTTGATLLADMIDRFWDTLHPDVKRLRGRANALQWFLEKTASALPQGELAPTELPKIEALETAAKRLAQLVRERFGDAAPAVSPMLERVERMRLSVAAPPALEQAPASAATATPSATSTATATPTATPSPTSTAAGELANAADATDFLRNLGGALIGAAGVLRGADTADPAGYRILRIGIWLHFSAPPPSSGGKTQIPPLPEPLRNQLATIAQNQKWAALLEESESAAPRHRFALDLHRFSWHALAGLGRSHDRAREALAAEVRSLLTRMPELSSLAFADASPFADPQTKSWLEDEIQKREVNGGRARQPAAGADGEAGAARIAQAKKLLGANQAAEALALLQDWVVSARGGRERFLARLELARLAAGAGLMAVAKATYDELERDSIAHDLDTWEPQLVAECLKGLIAATRALSKDPRGAAPDLTVPYKRLCRLDPAAAHEVWP